MRLCHYVERFMLPRATDMRLAIHHFLMPLCGCLLANICNGQELIPPEPVVSLEAHDRHSCKRSDLWLTHAGDQIVALNGPRLLLIDRSTKNITELRSDGHLRKCWTCPQTGGLFVISSPTWEFLEHELYGLEVQLEYLESPEDWLSWNIAWSVPVFYREGVGLQFLPESEQVVIIEREKGTKRNTDYARKSYLRILSCKALRANASMAVESQSKIELPGYFVGLERTNGKLLAYYARRVFGTRDNDIFTAVVDEHREDLLSHKRLKRLNYQQLLRLPRPEIHQSGSTQRDYAYPNPAFVALHAAHFVGLRRFQFRGGPQRGDIQALIAQFSVDPTFYMAAPKLGVLDEQMSTIGDRTLHIKQGFNLDRLIIVPQPDGLLRIADVVRHHEKYSVLTCERGTDFEQKRTLRVWDIRPADLVP